MLLSTKRDETGNPSSCDSINASRCITRGQKVILEIEFYQCRLGRRRVLCTIASSKSH